MQICSLSTLVWPRCSARLAMSSLRVMTWRRRGKMCVRPIDQLNVVRVAQHSLLPRCDAMPRVAVVWLRRGLEVCEALWESASHQAHMRAYRTARELLDDHAAVWQASDMDRDTYLHMCKVWNNRTAEFEASVATLPAAAAEPSWLPTAMREALRDDPAWVAQQLFV